MLATTWHSHSGTPVVFLHGFLGSQQDWQPVLSLLQNTIAIRPLTLDLAGHGQSQAISCHSFQQAREQLHFTLQQHLAKQPFYLVGYSLGGRLALDYALTTQNPYLKGILLEGTNIGLSSDEEKKVRWQNDCHWADRLSNEPLANVLEDWYRQPVFANLSESKRTDFIKKRLNNHGQALAQMLKATSLATQPYFSPEQRRQFHGKMLFIIGEKDSKFRQMAEQHQLPYHQIANAGHNTHCENPSAFVKHLIQFISK
ncbi:2-succinyl-6-hydroxy-2,4-cyclohexadiene-1-carboxylate synthase [Glaesserella parasuis]|uniref:2-succinyl-6-hydroxy-2, 4-cyclohexadiene-1-carboxylate synthase n=1 Tax=Glaesserella parasuis TaxID=738 RepID=UPI002436DA11|nr:2-succinyl-6-hydroxy-2,4-cyclohexadiene-1-carboxylate synthase [Glaesserella parasuis]MDG6301945.1 2-succinyl-6-hydroxy-2,4-cyclohexadiene-1-carboxylate synthase [Glaesserella parasuis]MDG6376954.1 2-succinyl-6-hydroxy-2,4-cyclohexadiene-1-carboxylate synthase [Glaesserella parasuis]MDP0356165.1 2-succinyl-6-hydroxy-2,4-cyclohexadiene-1-carboxylate synthase [Glaesserella parasuis]